MLIKYVFFSETCMRLASVFAYVNIFNTPKIWCLVILANFTKHNKSIRFVDPSWHLVVFSLLTKSKNISVEHTVKNLFKMPHCIVLFCLLCAMVPIVQAQDLQIQGNHMIYTWVPLVRITNFIQGMRIMKLKKALYHFSPENPRSRHSLNYVNQRTKRNYRLRNWSKKKEE